MTGRERAVRRRWAAAAVLLVGVVLAIGGAHVCGEPAAGTRHAGPARPATVLSVMLPLA